MTFKDGMLPYNGEENGQRDNRYYKRKCNVKFPNTLLFIDNIVYEMLILKSRMHPGCFAKISLLK